MLKCNIKLVLSDFLGINLTQLMLLNLLLVLLVELCPVVHVVQ